jgi:ABC-type Co2+ transport system permease subunit
MNFIPWWVWPVLIVVIGLVVGLIEANKDDNSMFPMDGLCGAFIFVLSFMVAAAFCVGHWIK